MEPIFPNEIVYLIGLEVDVFTLATLRETCSSYYHLFSKLAKERYPTLALLTIIINMVNKRFCPFVSEGAQHISDLFTPGKSPVYRKTRNGFDYYQSGDFISLTRKKWLIKKEECCQPLCRDLLIREEITKHAILEMRVTSDDFIPLRIYPNDRYQHMLGFSGGWDYNTTSHSFITFERN